MNAPMVADGMVTMPRAEFEELLERVAERGARAALAEVGLDGDDAAADVRELRSLLDAFNAAKRTAWQTTVRMITTGLVLALVAGAVIKLEVFGGGR
ncbi:organic solvent tolerance protein OstA [Ralstonia solanacearum]|nr:organic solvent tolerance protein OstA [Ralstonia solanacearum]